MPFEFTILDFIQAYLQSDLMTAVMSFLTSLANHGTIWILLSLILLLLPKTRRIGLVVGVSLLLEAIVCNGILKPIVARPRPCDVNAAIALLIPHPGGYSFPSGHAGASFASASALYFAGSPLGIPALILAALISFSRLYFYVHFPTDVLTGAVIGTLLGWAVSRAARVIASRSARR